MVHKRVKKKLRSIKKAIAIKKRLPKKGPVKHDLPSLSEIPAFFPYPGIGRLALRNPGLATAVGTYMLMEATQPYWGPPVEAHGERTREQFDAFMDEYFGSRGQVGPPTVLKPQWPRFTPEREMPRAPTKTKRKTSKANKAMKKAYAFLRKQHKGKLTQKKCRELMRKAAKMASKANPGTKSRIGKKLTKMLKECRKIRRSVWGTNKRN